MNLNETSMDATARNHRSTADRRPRRLPRTGTWTRQRTSTSC